MQLWKIKFIRRGGHTHGRGHTHTSKNIKFLHFRNTRKCKGMWTRTKSRSHYSCARRSRTIHNLYLRWRRGNSGQNILERHICKRHTEKRSRCTRGRRQNRTRRIGIRTHIRLHLHASICILTLLNSHSKRSHWLPIRINLRKFSKLI